MSAPPNMCEEALAYARLGLKVLPVWAPYGRLCSCGKERCPSPGKHPHGVLGATGGLNLATTDELTITRWWTDAPDANIGIALRASGLVAFDVDKPENYDALAAAEARLGELPRTLLQISGSGNWHVIFRAPPHDIVGVFDGIVMRAKNFIVAAPSLHASGNRYAWKPGFRLGEAAPAELPEAWQDALRRPEGAGEVGVPPESSEPAWLRAISGEERLRRMREHLAREPGEQKGVSGPGTAFNVTRTCARGFAVREPDALLRILIDEYDVKCAPPYGAERVRQRVQKVYDQATSPSWGACLMPPDQSLAVVIGQEAVDEIAARRAQAAAPPTPPTRDELRFHFQSVKGKLARRVDPESKRDAERLGRVLTRHGPEMLHDAGEDADEDPGDDRASSREARA